MKTFAGIATLPGRPLERALRSLRPQVDTIGVFLNGDHATDPPGLELADHVVRADATCDGNAGSSAKFWWWYACRVPDLYFGCDDDLEYPPDYVARMRAAWEQWGPRVIVSAAGRTLRPDATRWQDWIGEGRYITPVPVARWINYVGGCALAFHGPSLPWMPPIRPPNEEEAVLSAWAQQEGVPIRLIARPYDWPRRIPLAPGAFTLYEEAARERFATRSRIISTVPRWTVHVPSREGVAA